MICGPFGTGEFCETVSFLMLGSNECDPAKSGGGGGCSICQGNIFSLSELDPSPSSPTFSVRIYELFEGLFNVSSDHTIDIQYLTSSGIETTVLSSSGL